MSTLSVIIPVLELDVERPGPAGKFKRTMESIVSQKFIEGDEILVIGDGPAPYAQSLVEEQGPPFSYETFGPDHCFGNPQRNHGIEKALGDYIVWMDDDDIFAEDAFELIRAALEIKPQQPHMFRFRTYWGEILWRSPGLVRCGQIGGHQFVAPNIPDKLGRWGGEYEGDYAFITSTLQHWETSDVVWRPEVIAICRPDELRSLRD